MATIEEIRPPGSPGDAQPPETPARTNRGRPKLLRECPHCKQKFASEELKKHEPGCRKPKGDPCVIAPDGRLIAISDKPLPLPPKFDCTPAQFFRYWNELQPNERPRVMPYCYRLWPVMDYYRGYTNEELQAIKSKQMPEPETNQDKGFDIIPLETWRESVLHKWGSGKYHLKLNDAGVKGNPNLPGKNLCMMTTETVMDPNYPPVLDYAKVDWDNRENAAYKRSLILKGIKIPGVTETQETDDMAGAAAETMANTVKDLTGEVVKMANNAQAQAAAAAQRPQPIDIHSQAQLKSGEIIAEASKEAIKIVTDATKRDAEAQDPNKYLQNVLSVAKEIMPKPVPPPPDSSEKMMGMFQLLVTQMQNSHTQIMEVMRQSHEASMRSMEARLAMAEAALKERNPANGATVTPTDPFALFGKFLDAMDKFNERTGGGPAANEGPAWLRPALGAVTAIANTVQTGMYNAAVAKTGQGTPMAPVATDLDAIESGEPGEPQNEEEMYGIFLKQIEQPLMKALNDGVPGYVFAAELAMSRGMTVYDQLGALGESGIYQFINRYDQALWQQLSRMPQKFTQFVQEFLNREEVMRAFEELQIARANAAAPPEPPRVVKTAKPEPPRPKQQGVPQAVVDARRNPQ